MSRQTPRSVTAWLCVFAIGSSPIPASSADGARTIALVDFAVGASGHQGEVSSWLGPAVTELLQAKLQLFGGTRVLERTRVQALVREAKIGEDAVGQDTAALSAIIPAEILIAGSVSVDPKDPRRVRVQARAMETATSRIVSEATFSGTDDLAGLLKIAEDFARTLADGLKLVYTPEQIAYAEPAKIDTLRLFVEGAGHLLAGRYREAIDSLQRALAGNEGRYYPAAHRLQGAAYQELAKAAAGEQERTIRTEYLEKFKKDALAASGALFDLGLAYEANAKWQEAIDAFEDYLTAVGQEGNVVRWDFNPRAAVGGEIDDNFPVFTDEAGRVHLFPDAAHLSLIRRYSWIILDAGSGKVLRSTPFPEEVHRLPDACGTAEYLKVDVIGLWEDRAITVGGGEAWACPYIAAVNKNGQIQWRNNLGGSDVGLVKAEFSGGLVFVQIKNQKEIRRLPQQLVTIDAGTGRILSRITIEGSLSSLDPARARWTVQDGTYDLCTGRLIEPSPAVAPQAVNPAGRAAEPLRPTGVRGVTYRREGQGLRFFRHGKEALFIAGSLDIPDSSGSSGHMIVLRRQDTTVGYAAVGYFDFILVDTTSWKTTILYEKINARFLAQNETHLAFLLPSDAREMGVNSTYELPTTERTRLLNILESSTGRVVSKFRLPDFHEPPVVTFVGDDLILSHPYRVMRVSIVPRSHLSVISTAETHLRIASCRIALGDTPAARKHLQWFESTFYADPRGATVRMKIAALEGHREEAERLALSVLGSGGVETEDAAACLAVLRKTRPEIRDVIFTPAHGRLVLHAIDGEGVLVATLQHDLTHSLHLRIDSRSKGTTILRTPGFRLQSVTSYAHGKVYGLGTDAGLLTYDLATGRRTGLKFMDASPKRLIPELARAVVLARGGPEPVKSIAFFDPEGLGIVFEALLEGSPQIIFQGNGKAVLTEPRWADKRREWSVLVLDTEHPAEILRLKVPLERERIATAAVTDGQIILGIMGGDFDKIDNWGLAAWLRIESFPIGAGERWSFRQEGVLAGTLLLEEERVCFPAFPGKFPAATVREKKDFPPFSRDREEMPLKLFTLDRRHGNLIAAEPQSPQPWTLTRDNMPPNAAREHFSDAVLEHASRLFAPNLPGAIFSMSSFEWKEEDTRRYWFFSNDYEPAKVEAGDRPEWRTAHHHFLANPMIVWRDLVFESIGGGAVLVKNYAGGAGVPSVFLKRVR